MPKIEAKDKVFIEICNAQQFKNKQVVCGDTFLSKKIAGDNRFVAVLSDGLGSGIKANVLSTMTASMALNYSMRHEPILRSALNIMNALPVDSVRNISYATFTIFDIDFEGNTKIVEFDSPEYLLFRDNKYISPTKEVIGIDRDGNEYRAYEGDKDLIEKMGNEAASFRKLYCSTIKLCKGDRLIAYSDGVTQAGMGAKEHPFGWGDANVIKFVQGVLNEKPDISARELSQLIVNQALQKDRMKCKDDISCAVIYARDPRGLLICSGPPYHSSKDASLALTIDKFYGKKIICGGTTSKIIARELDRDLFVDLTKVKSKKYPPVATMKGVDLVTEGILTLGAVIELLEKEEPLDRFDESPAAEILRLILDSDVINLIIGTRINEAHQDPSLPVELEIRRNVVKRIAYLLEEKWLKKVNVSFI